MSNLRKGDSNCSLVEIIIAYDSVDLMACSHCMTHGQGPGNDGFLYYAMYRKLHRDRDQETMGFYIMLCTVHTTQGPGNDGFLYYAMYCTHYTGTGNGKRWVSILCCVPYTLHRDREWEMMGFYIMLCTVHTTQGQGPGNDGFLYYAMYRTHYTWTGTGK